MTAGLDRSLAGLLDSIRALDPLAGEHVERRARHLVLDTIGCAVAGLATEPARLFAHELAGAEPGPLRFPGLPGGLSPSAFLMAFSAAACAFEGPEGLASAQGRPGLHAVPAVLSEALRLGKPLRDVLAAIVVGYEVGGRIGQIYRIPPGMHVDGTWGTFGAVAGLARLAGLSPAATLSALDIAACQLPLSLYHPIRRGSVARNLYAGHGAVLARFAVAAAATGTDRPAGSLAEHMRVLLGKAPEALPARQAGEPWLLEQGYLKKYPVTKHVHYGVEAAIRWRRSGGAVGTGDRIVLSIYRNAITYCGLRGPVSPIQAQFSLAWGLAWALAHGNLTAEAFSPAGLADRAARALEARIEIVEDPVLTREDRRGASLAIGPRDGAMAAVTVGSVPGDPEEPLSRAELVGKFLAGAVPVIGRREAETVVAAILDGALDRPLALG